MGFRSAVLTALSKEIPQGRHCLDRQGAVWTGKAPSRRHRAVKNAILRCPGLRCMALGLPHCCRDTGRLSKGHLAVQGLSLRKTKGQQLKGKIVSALFSHFLFHFSTRVNHTFSEFSPRTSLKIKAFSLDNKKKRTKPCCTLVVARLSSSKSMSLACHATNREAPLEIETTSHFPC